MIKKLLTNVSIAFVYREASFQSETISQTHLGEPLEVLEEKEDWVRVRQLDNYEGWVARFYLVSKPNGWDDHELFFPAKQISWIRQSPDQQAVAIRDLTILSGVPVLGRQTGWVQVLLPDGSQGWMEDNPRYPVKDPDVELLIQTAMGFLGIQYFWAGRSPKGFDCSGFTQTCFALNGIQLPRDAYQQAKMGVEVSHDFRSWQPGDLIFFSQKTDRITHVAISLGNGDFVHASGYVKLNSINPNHEDLFIERYAGIYTKTIRVL